MSKVLHVYKTSDFTRSVVEGQDVRALCGGIVHPRTRDGHTVPTPREGNSICIDCLGEVGPEEAVRILEQSKVKEAA